jgi:O-antigen/teichoic acid export membrane protein
MQDIKVQMDFFLNWIKKLFPILTIALLLSPLTKYLYVFINGTRYEHSFNIFLILLLTLYQGLLLSPLVNIIIGREEYKLLACLAFITLIVVFTGNYLVVKPFGAAGVAFITFLSGFIINFSVFIRLLFIKIKYEKQKYLLKENNFESLSENT